MIPLYKWNWGRIVSRKIHINTARYKQKVIAKTRNKLEENEYKKNLTMYFIFCPLFDDKDLFSNFYILWNYQSLNSDKMFYLIHFLRSPTLVLCLEIGTSMGYENAHISKYETESVLHTTIFISSWYFEEGKRI